MLILASNSPRRRQLLGWLGIAFETRAANIDETPLAGEAPGEYTRRLAQAKAWAVSQGCQAGDLILASDTTVAVQNVGDSAPGSGRPSILGKPGGAAEAEMMLRQLRGRTHQVYTAAALVKAGSVAVELCCTDVLMRAYSDGEMMNYIQSGDPLDKAGAYAIQHNGFHPVEGIEGCFASVMGFPMCHVLRLLARVGIVPQVNMPKRCLDELGYDCPVYSSIYQPV